VGFIILEWIADFLSGNANCEFHPKKNINQLRIILGVLLMSLSFYVLLINIWAGILIVSILFITFGEMFIFPFSNSFALSRAQRS
jgi:dipeptide/tripeptide permease